MNPTLSLEYVFSSKSVLTINRIVVGGTNGQFPTVFGKIATLHAKNSFAFAIVAGNLFADPASSSDHDEQNLTSLLSGSISVPLTTYFTLGQHPLPPRVVEKLESSGGEVCENLYYLGKRTTLKTSEGVKIVALGGQLDSHLTVGVSKDKYTPLYTEDDAKALRGANTADILVTSAWPVSIRAGSKIALPDSVQEPASQQSIADLCVTLKPRYHISSSPDFFYEREPFFHMPAEQNPDERPVTRFLSLASYGNAGTQKWLYAFSLDPLAAHPVTVSPGTTASPLSRSTRKRPAAKPDKESFSRFSHWSASHHKRPKRARQPPPGPSECFFCLSNPNLATHLITSIANDSYLTTARGPLSTSTTYPSLDFPCHILIIPLTHSPTLSSVTDATSRSSTYQEMVRYRHALQSMLLPSGDGQLGAVTWEVSRAEGIHTHWQFLPVARDLVDSGLVEAAFKVEAENEKYPIFESRDVGEGDGEGDFFRVWIWAPKVNAKSDEDERTNNAVDNKTIHDGKSLILPLSDDFRFDLQFGRRVLAKLLGLENRMNWKDCMQSQEDETADVEAFKKAFKAFDFSIE